MKSWVSSSTGGYMGATSQPNLVSFSGNAKASNVGVGSDPIEKASHHILSMLEEAAGAVKATCDKANDAAQRYANELRYVEARTKELEDEVRHYHDRATRAEKWIGRVGEEIEARFFGRIPARTSD